MPIAKVGVVGCGLMGSGIAQATAQRGFPTVVREVNQELLDKGASLLRSSLERSVEKKKMFPAERDAALANLTFTLRLEDFRDCDLVLEAIIENIAEKRKLFRELDGICDARALFASNTSSLSIPEMAAATRRPDRFLGLHFFNPVPIMKLVELVRAHETSDATLASAREFAERLGKVAIVAKDSPGFVVNLLLVPYLLDAIRALESGVASREDIDQGMKLGCGHPMGPLELLDFVGLDTTYYIAQIMFDEFKDPRYAAPPLLKRMVLAGHLGKKSRRGFYAYS
ncbi:MAG: 3-hydroxybutyryl-CoA dehydrogenase [Planctomycetes bacterium]|nr:3-hydroxybutyryl-CoA dehydrogenase [Planctomycetota bacterium]